MIGDSGPNTQSPGRPAFTVALRQCLTSMVVASISQGELGTVSCPLTDARTPLDTASTTGSWAYDSMTFWKMDSDMVAPSGPPMMTGLMG